MSDDSKARTGNINSRFDSRLIRKRRQQPRLQRAAWGFVTLAFWGFYFYLWAPLLILLSWLFGGRLAWLQLYDHRQHLDPFLIVVMPIVLGCCAVVLIAWAEYNRFRFTGKERRSPLKNAATEEVAHGLGAPPHVAVRLSSAKVITLHMDGLARPVGMTEQPA